MKAKANIVMHQRSNTGISNVAAFPLAPSPHPLKGIGSFLHSKINRDHKTAEVAAIMLNSKRKYFTVWLLSQVLD